MKSSTLLAGGIAILLCPALAGAQTSAPPFVPDKQYSADETITTGDRTTEAKSAVDNGKVRMEMNMNGMPMISIVRPDQGKMYSVMVEQKMMMVMPLSPATQQKMAAMTDDSTKFETAGPDTVDGTACTKYKMTTKDGSVYFLWANATSKTPVKLASQDGATSIVYKNYKAGAPDASLFDPPAGFQVMNMPAMPGGMPGGGGAPGGAPAPGGQ